MNNNAKIKEYMNESMKAKVSLRKKENNVKKEGK